MRKVSQGGDSDSSAVAAYLKYVLSKNLRKGVPGLHMYLTGVAFTRYGMSLEDLLWERPSEFVKLLKEYFQSGDVVSSILEVILKELTRTQEGEEALKALMNGDEEAFREKAVKALEKEAKSWVKNLI
ncbi:MAG: hypothetical protein J7L55_02055 [Desulfurococcales archaeon]|nr:hypothetical protein [Desulfurococcales archaeon]